MFILLHTNVDGYLSERNSWEEKPTKEELYSTLFEYHSEEESWKATEELLKYKEGSIMDSSNTRYTLLES